MEEKPQGNEIPILSVFLELCILSVLIGLCYNCYKALRNETHSETQHPKRTFLLIVVAISVILIIVIGVQVQLEINREIEREKQREIERAKQREIERAKQREIERAKQREIERAKQREFERQERLKEQRQQELFAILSFVIFIVILIFLIYKVICYLITPDYMLQQKQIQVDKIKNLQRIQEWQERLNDSIRTARVRRELESMLEMEWQPRPRSYKYEHSKQESSVKDLQKYPIQREKNQAREPIGVYRELQLSPHTSNLYLKNRFRESFKSNFSLLDLNYKDREIIKKLFSNKFFLFIYQINKIKKLHNENVSNRYIKKKQKYYNIYGTELQEKYLFHGTTQSVVDSICTNNFDLTKVESGLHGWGISFANNPYYASHYSTKYCDDINYVMILARVLIGRKQVGYEGQMYPIQGFDTTTNDDGQVLVKYEEDTFYPEFIVYFSKKN